MRVLFLLLCGNVVCISLYFAIVVDDTMAIRMHVDGKLCEGEATILHSMPCKIMANEAANVSTHFTPYIESTNDTSFTSSFRGYPIQGKKISIPPLYKGIIFSEHQQPGSDGDKRNLYASGTFQKMTYWNYDRLPTANDTFVKAFDWIDIAEVLHSANPIKL